MLKTSEQKKKKNGSGRVMSELTAAPVSKGTFEYEQPRLKGYDP